jgi:uncharacterized membrane protein YfcA
MDTTTALLLVLSGIGVGIGASFSGLGGGFIMVPLLLFMGYTAQKAVGTSFLAHSKFAHVEYKTGILLGLGGLIGAQLGAYLVQQVSTTHFKKIFASILVGLAVYLFSQK